MSNQDIAFITVCGLFSVTTLHLWKAWRDLIEYQRRAVHAELEVRRLTAHAACAQAEIRALESKLLEREAQS